MRYLFALCVALTVLFGLSALAQEKKAPPKLTFKAANGNVTFDHAAHLKREKNDCKVCHDKLWPQNATAPLGYKAGMHRPAETKKVSCGACHTAGGTAFESKANCNKCHVKAAAKG